ncbi:MAG: AraC family transcriptional regulator [Candidatus Eremiobacteraeota bacterium]|nr:AraC family transcriptional regulator [Candidatus Eremiobacteraeota bacterium]
MTDANGAPGKVFILAYDDCDQLDVTGPLEILGTLVMYGVKLDLRIVSIPGTTEDPGGMVRAANGLRFASEPWDGRELPDLLIVAGGTLTDRSNPNEPGGIVLLATKPFFTEKITNQQASGKLVTSVCTGAFGIVGAHVVEGRTITSHPGVLDELRAFAACLGENVTIIGPDATDPEPNARVVDDHDLVTCGGVTSGIDEAVYLVQKYWPSQLDAVRSFVDYHYQAKVLTL